MKCNQSRPGFELVSSCPFPTTINITTRAPPLLHFMVCQPLWVILRQILFIHAIFKVNSLLVTFLNVSELISLLTVK